MTIRPFCSTVMFRRNRVLRRVSGPSIVTGLRRGVRLLRNHLAEWPRRYVEMRIDGRLE